MLVLKVRGKPHNSDACLCGSLYSTLKQSFEPYAFLRRNRYKRFSNTNLPDPRQRVSLKGSGHYW